MNPEALRCFAVGLCCSLQMSYTLYLLSRFEATFLHEKAVNQCHLQSVTVDVNLRILAKSKI